MALTSIGFQKTPGRPVEITFAAETGLPSDNQEVALIGHAASGATGIYEVIPIENSADLAAASAEAETKFGAGSELAKMVIAAVRANSGSSTYPALKAIPLASTDTDFGASNEALTALESTKAEYAVSPYDGTNDTLRDLLKASALLMSGAQRVENQQFGTIGVVFNRAETTVANLPAFDTEYLCGIYLQDTGTGPEAPAYSIGEMAAAAAAKMAGNILPFNPLDSETINGIAAPAKQSDHPTVGAGLKSEAVLERGWTPLFVKPNGEVAFVRTVTGRLTVDADGVTEVTAYYDVQDFNVLYFFRKTIFTRFNQPDFKQRKASAQTALEIKSEVIRLMTSFEDQNMFQAVTELAKLVQVERSISDRHRFDVKIPVNVIPGLHVIATNIEAGTLFDTVSV